MAFAHAVGFRRANARLLRTNPTAVTYHSDPSGMLRTAPSETYFNPTRNASYSAKSAAINARPQSMAPSMPTSANIFSPQNVAGLEKVAIAGFGLFVVLGAAAYMANSVLNPKRQNK
ncbi:MAG: hypothetical protein KGI06_02090 [Candidatus Micrarchaeota archaeon]|nr:hypothetical protein [Candidatus Micrarchaeota archaeon]